MNNLNFQAELIFLSASPKLSKCRTFNPNLLHRFFVLIVTSWVSREADWIGDYCHVLLGKTSVITWRKQDWEEGEVEVWCSQNRSLSWSHSGLNSWESSEEMSPTEAGGLLLWTPLLQGKLTSRTAFGEDFPDTISFQTPLLPPSQDIVQLQPIFGLHVNTEPTHLWTQHDLFSPLDSGSKVVLAVGVSRGGCVIAVLVDVIGIWIIGSYSYLRPLVSLWLISYVPLLCYCSQFSAADAKALLQNLRCLILLFSCGSLPYNPYNISSHHTFL